MRLDPRAPGPRRDARGQTAVATMASVSVAAPDFGWRHSVAFLTYGAATSPWPVLALHCVLLPINLYRLFELHRAGRCQRASQSQISQIAKLAKFTQLAAPAAPSAPIAQRGHFTFRDVHGGQAVPMWSGRRCRRSPK